MRVRRRLLGGPPRDLRLPPDAAERRFHRGAIEWAQLGAPSRHRDQAGLHQIQPLEEPCDLFRAAEVVGDRATLAVAPGGLPVGVADIEAVGQRQVTAGWQGIQQPLHDRARLVVVSDVPEDPDQEEPDGLAEVKGPGGRTQDRCRVTQVGVDVVGRALRVLVSRARAGASTSGSLST